MHHNLWSLIWATDTISKIILLSLLIMSIACWALALYKLLMIKAKMRDMQQAHHALKSLTTFDELFTKSASWKESYAGYLIAQYLTEYKLYALTADKSRLALTEKDAIQFENSVEMIMSLAVQEAEAYTPVLSTVAAISPMIGLLGTVWGLIHSLVAIAAVGSADIAAVAPGMAEALITTLAGIIVAVPALILFNVVSNAVRSFDTQLLVLTDKCLALLKTIPVSDVHTGTAHIQQPPSSHHTNIS